MKAAQGSEFTDGPDLEFNLAVEEERTVTLEVKNSFGQVAARDFVIKRPKPDLSRSGPARRIQVEQGDDGQLRGKVEVPDRPALNPTIDPTELSNPARDLIKQLQERRRQAGQAPGGDADTGDAAKKGAQP